MPQVGGISENSGGKGKISEREVDRKTERDL